MADILTAGIVMGLVATAMMDAWAVLLHRATAIPMPNWAMVGRWVAHLPRGRVFHEDIGQGPGVAGELTIGWVFHYAVGVIYGIALAFLMGAEWLAAPTFAPAWGFSILMLGFGWFLLQPGLGLGWAAAKTPEPAKVRALGILAHTVFGAGLWLGALI